MLYIYIMSHSASPPRVALGRPIKDDDMPNCLCDWTEDKRDQKFTEILGRLFVDEVTYLVGWDEHK